MIWFKRKELSRLKRRTTPRRTSYFVTDEESMVNRAIAQYSAANARRFQNFSFVWQASALGLAGQAFLFTIVLGSTTSNMGRDVACALSIAIAFASLILIHSQRDYQETEGRWMDLIEEEFSFPQRMEHNKGKAVRHDAVLHAEARISSRASKEESRTWTASDLLKVLLRSKLTNDATFAWSLLWWAVIAADVTVLVVVGTNHVALLENSL